MLLLAKFLANVISILNSEISPKQIAAGFAWGVVIGLLPVRGLLPYFLTVIAFIININLAAMGVAALIFKIVSFAVDPLANKIGFILLTQVRGLKSIWTQLYNLPILPYTRFNNTIVMGSFVMGLLLLIPMYFLAQAGVVNYRARLRDKFLKLKLVQILKASAFWRWYETYRGIRGE
jgi:uncharacterized protein (TIGR03546 family)